MKIYCQGNLVSEEEVSVAIGDHGFLFGLSLFETFRTCGGEPFLLEEHLQRIRRGCDAFGIVPGNDLLVSDASALRQVLRNLLESNGLADAVFRLTISAGVAAGGLGGVYENPTEFIFVRKLPPPAPENGIGLHVLKTRRTPPECFPRPKSGNFANSIFALRELRQRTSAASDEGLLLTVDGRVSEGTVSNVFFVRGTTLFTPPPSAHILEGITRKHVLELAGKVGFEAREEAFSLAETAGAEAIFTTNSVRGLTPVSAVFAEGDNLFWRGDSGQNAIFRQLAAAYSESQRLALP